MPRPLRVEGRVLSSSIRRPREMWIHFVFTIQCSGKGCICRGVSDSVAMRGCYYWVKSRFCNCWEFLMASKHAGLEIVLWLNELVRIWDCSREEGVHMPGLTFYCFRVPNLLTLCSCRVPFFLLRFMWARRNVLSCSCLPLRFHPFLCWSQSRNQHSHQASAML